MSFQKNLSTVTLAVLVGGAMAFPGAAGAAELGKTLAEITALAKKEGTVHMAASWRKKLRNAISKGFKKKYGLKIKATRVRGLASRERILNEAIGGIVAQDVVNVSGELREQYIKAGVVQKVDWARLFPKINKTLIGPRSYYIATGFSKYGVAYNTKLVPPNLVPKTWADCANQRWKGKVAVMTRPRAYTALWAGWGREKSLAFHKKLKANNPVWSRGNTVTGTKIASGEQPLGCGLGLHSVINVKRRDPTATIAFKLLTEVPIQIGEGLAVMKGAKNPNAAVLLAGYLSSKEGEGHYHIQGRSSPFIEGSVADKMVKKAGAKLVWGGWKWAGKREADASRQIVEAWGFPKAKR